MGAILLAMAMAGAPVASGMVFSICLQYGQGNMRSISSKLLMVNTIGGVIGVVLTGPFLMPMFGIVNTTILLSSLCVLGGIAFVLRQRPQLSLGALSGFTVMTLAMPTWDVAVYATGLYNRIGEFVDLSPQLSSNSAHEGWEPRFYIDGHSASIAVGQSTRTQNLWLSINGKVDASTGDDMPTQILSGELPLKIHPKTGNVETLVVGLASGVTANEAKNMGLVT